MESTDTVDAAGADQQHEVAAQPENDGSAPSQPDSAAETPERKPGGGFQKRIMTLSGRLGELTQQVSAKDARIAELEAQVSGKKPDSNADKPPDEKDFNDYSEYLRAVARHDVRQEFKAERAREQAEREAQDRQRSESRTRERQQAQVREFVSQIETHAADVPDFREAVSTAMQMIPVTSPIGQALLSSDMGAALTYYLHDNPAELDRLESIQDPVKAAIAIARLESKAEAHIQSRTRSRASRQASPLAGGGSGKSDVITGTESMEEFARKWDARRRR